MNNAQLAAPTTTTAAAAANTLTQLRRGAGVHSGTSDSSADNSASWSCDSGRACGTAQALFSARAGSGGGSERDGAGGVKRVTSGRAGVATAANAGADGIGCSIGLGGAGRRKAGDVGGSIHGSVVDFVESRTGPVRGSVRSLARGAPPDLRGAAGAAGAAEVGAVTSAGVVPLGTRARTTVSAVTGLSSTVSDGAAAGVALGDCPRSRAARSRS